MNPLDFTPRDFNAYLAEMYPDGGGNAGFLRQQYREKNNVTNILPDGGLADGRQAVAGGFASKDAGATGRDAMRSLRPAIWNGIRGLLQGGGGAVQAPLDAYRGQLSPDEMTGAAMGTAGMAMGGGLLATSPQGALRSNSLMGGGRSDPTPRNDAEAMAQKVLEMRAAGNAGDVTEDMMALADDTYMYDNTPLPMDEASRAGRRQGYDPDYFHGTGSDIVGVDLSKLGEKQNVLGEGFYTTQNTGRADRYVPKVTDDYGDRVYAEGGSVIPLVTKGAGEFDLTAQTGKQNVSRIAKAFEGSDFDVELRDGGDSAFIKSKNDPKMSVYIDSYAEGQNTLARLKDAFGNANLTPIFKEAGFTGLKGVEGAGSNVRVSYDPSNVRSRFARFDPEFKHLRNLSAGIGGVGLLNAIMEEEQRQKQGLL